MKKTVLIVPLFFEASLIMGMHLPDSHSSCSPNLSFHKAVIYENIAEIRTLCANGATLEKGALGWTPLHWATTLGCKEITAYLILWYGKDSLHIQSPDGKTAFDVSNESIRKLLSDPKKLDAALERQRSIEVQRAASPHKNIFVSLKNRELGKR